MTSNGGLTLVMETQECGDFHSGVWSHLPVLSHSFWDKVDPLSKKIGAVITLEDMSQHRTVVWYIVVFQINCDFSLISVTYFFFSLRGNFSYKIDWIAFISVFGHFSTANLSVQQYTYQICDPVRRDFKIYVRRIVYTSHMPYVLTIKRTGEFVS